MYAMLSKQQKAAMAESLIALTVGRDEIPIGEARVWLHKRYPELSAAIDGMATARVLRAIGFAKDHSRTAAPGQYRRQS